jgi:hypothetical protein
VAKERRRTVRRRRGGDGKRWGPLGGWDGEDPRAPQNVRKRWPVAKCSSCCGSCWSRYSAIPFLILQMGGEMKRLLETVLATPSRVETEP